MNALQVSVWSVSGRCVPPSPPPGAMLGRYAARAQRLQGARCRPTRRVGHPIGGRVSLHSRRVSSCVGCLCFGYVGWNRPPTTALLSSVAVAGLWLGCVGESSGWAHWGCAGCEPTRLREGRMCVCLSVCAPSRERACAHFGGVRDTSGPYVSTEGLRGMCCWRARCVCE